MRSTDDQPAATDLPPEKAPEQCTESGEQDGVEPELLDTERSDEKYPWEEGVGAAYLAGFGMGLLVATFAPGSPMAMRIMGLVIIAVAGFLAFRPLTRWRSGGSR